MAVRLAKYLNGADTLPAGFWCRDHESQRDILSCPGCGRHHVINAAGVAGDGAVAREWSCGGCSFASWLQLEAWKP